MIHFEFYILTQVDRCFFCKHNEMGSGKVNVLDYRRFYVQNSTNLMNTRPFQGRVQQGKGPRGIVDPKDDAINFSLPTTIPRLQHFLEYSRSSLTLKSVVTSHSYIAFDRSGFDSTQMPCFVFDATFPNNPLDTGKRQGISHVLFVRT